MNFDIFSIAYLQEDMYLQFFVEIHFHNFHPRVSLLALLQLCARGREPVKFFFTNLNVELAIILKIHNLCKFENYKDCKISQPFVNFQFPTIDINFYIFSIAYLREDVYLQFFVEIHFHNFHPRVSLLTLLQLCARGREPAWSVVFLAPRLLGVSSTLQICHRNHRNPRPPRTQVR
jgi:hypothetical protein